MASDELRFIRERYRNVASAFDRITAPAEWLAFRRLRRAIVPKAEGRVLEVAVGTGQNLQLYGRGVDLTAVDLSPEMLACARARAANLGIAAEFQEADAGDLPFPDGLFDSVVSTFAGCTFPDPVQAYREMWRVLRPGGRLLVAEHGLGDGRMLAWLLRRLAPWHFRQIACHLDREPLNLLSAAGIEAQVQDRMLGGTLLAATATKP